MFRHGASQDAFIEGGLDLVCLRTGHLSKAAARDYAKSDAERSQLASTVKKMDAKAKNAFLDELAKKAAERGREACVKRDASTFGSSSHFETTPASNFKSQYKESKRAVEDQGEGRDWEETACLEVESREKSKERLVVFGLQEDFVECNYQEG